jgi:TRAP-type mannitol/chloroaromatic compound transport system permease large subunit
MQGMSYRDVLIFLVGCVMPVIVLLFIFLAEHLLGLPLPHNSDALAALEAVAERKRA